MVHSARWLSASARPKSRHVWQPSACCSASQRRSRSTSREACAGVGAKDSCLLISRIGVAGGARQVIEYRGATIRALSMEERMTVCNMSIEAGARAGMIAPDSMTFEYLARPAAGAGGRGLRSRGGAVEQLPGDTGAACDREMRLDALDRADDQLWHEPGHGDADRRCDSSPGDASAEQVLSIWIWSGEKSAR